VKDEVRGAIVIAAVVALYAGGVYLRRAMRTSFGQSATLAAGKEASEILQADAIALVSDTDDAVEVWPRGSTRSASIPTRAALVRWLCSADAPRDTAVVMLRDLPLGRGRLDQASREGRLVVEELRGADMGLGCASPARFYKMEIRSGDPR
jgi:hypothetical protein